MAMNKVRINESVRNRINVCYDVNIEFELKFTGMKFATSEIETEAEICEGVSSHLIYDAGSN